MFRLLFQFFIRNFACEFKKKRFMTTYALNNLWTYIEGLSLKQKDRKWLANKLLEPVEELPHAVIATAITAANQLNI